MIVEVLDHEAAATMTGEAFDAVDVRADGISGVDGGA